MSIGIQPSDTKNLRNDNHCEQSRMDTSGTIFSQLFCTAYSMIFQNVGPDPSVGRGINKMGRDKKEGNASRAMMF